jgi:hypothetical protein
MYGESTGNRLGNSISGLGPMTQRPRWFNPHPIQKYATD